MTVTYRVYVLAGRSALALGDVERAKSAYADTMQIGVHGRWATASLATLQAGIHALEGRATEAIAAYGEAARAWRALELPFELGLCLLEFATFVGVARREARVAAEEARTIFEELGAMPLLARVQGAMAASATTTPANESRPKVDAGKAAATTSAEA